LGFHLQAFFDSIPGSMQRGEIAVAEPRHYPQADLFRPALEAIIDLGHSLLRLAGKIDWGFLDRRFARSARRETDSRR
jgi:IS5 family transposase